MNQPSPQISRRQFVKNAAAFGAAAMVVPHVLAQDKSGLKRPVLGEGEHVYEAYHDWLVPPVNIKWGDTHGLCQDRQGRIYVAHTVHRTSERAEAVLVFDPNGSFITAWGAQFRNGAHGLDIRDERGEEFLYHCDINRRLIVKTNLDGKVLWEKGLPTESQRYASVDRWRPTNIAFGAGGDFYVGDGYGSSYIHQYRMNGDYLRTIGTPGNGEGQLNCPHGLWVDRRSGREQLVVADRSNRRLQYFTMDGKHLGFVTEGMRLPCHFKTRGDLMLIPDLESVILLLDRDNKVVASLGDGHPSKLRGAPRDQFIPGKFIHPHDAIFLESGDILVAEWVPVGRITLLKKMS